MGKIEASKPSMMKIEPAKLETEVQQMFEIRYCWVCDEDTEQTILPTKNSSDGHEYRYCTKCSSRQLPE
jgi:hypothetical protein